MFTDPQIQDVLFEKGFKKDVSQAVNTRNSLL